MPTLGRDELQRRCTRLLSILDVMSKADAAVFEGLTKFVYTVEHLNEGDVKFDERPMLLVFNDGANQTYQQESIAFNGLRDLDSLGLVTASDAESGTLQFYIDTSKIRVRNLHGSFRLALPRGHRGNSWPFPCGTVNLTTAGWELFRIVKKHSADQSLQVALSEIKRISREYDLGIGISEIEEATPGR